MNTINESSFEDDYDSANKFFALNRCDDSSKQTTFQEEGLYYLSFFKFKYRLMND